MANSVAPSMSNTALAQNVYDLAEALVRERCKR